MRQAWFGDGPFLDITESLHMIGHVLMAQQQYDAAQGYLKQALDNAQRLFSVQNFDTTLLRDRLACLYIVQGKFTQAEDIMIEITAHLGTSNLTKSIQAMVIDHLGILRYLQGDLIMASQLLGESRILRRDLLGPMHPQTAHSLLHWGMLLHQTGNHAQAVAVVAQATAIYNRRLAKGHALTRQGEVYSHWIPKGDAVGFQNILSWE